jgi:hypothetical protein
MMARCLVPQCFNYRLGLLSLLSLGLVMGCGSPAEISSDQTSEAIVAPAAEAEEAAAPAARAGMQPLSWPRSTVCRNGHRA